MIDKIMYFRLTIIAFFMALVLSLSPAKASDWIYTTVAGDSLWNLSEKHLDRVTRYAQLKKINGIKSPKQMQPGTQIRIPMKWIRSNSVPAEIISIQGSAVLYQADGTVQQELHPGTLIHLGDRLKSGANSSAAVKFADNSILTLHSDSIIQFDHLSAHGTTGMVNSRLHLLEGRMDTRVQPAQGPGSRFEIQTPSAISAVRGTEYRASVVLESQSSNIEVLEGNVAVSGAQKKRLIKAGYGTRIVSGKAPIAPLKLLAAPQFKSIDETLHNIHSVISWEPVKDAMQYRIEVTADNSFNTILWQQFSPYLHASLPDLNDGLYFIRVRAVDNLGLEGNSSVHPVRLDAHPQPPIQLQPATAYISRGKPPELLWTASSEADKYQLEIAADKDFKDILLKQDQMDVTQFVATDLSQTGRYYWRMNSIAADGEVGPPGTIRSYEIKPLPAKVEADIDTSGEGELVASWHAGTSEQTYQVQLANDPDFSDLESDQVIDEPSISFEAVSAQIRYLRVRALEADGYQGPWGATQQIAPLPDDTFWLIPLLGFLGLIFL